MSVAELLADLEVRGVTLRLDGGRVTVDPRAWATLTEAEQAELREHREEIREALAGEADGSASRRSEVEDASSDGAETEGQSTRVATRSPKAAERVPVTWPRPRNQPEWNAHHVTVQLSLTEPLCQNWRHGAAGDVRLGIDGFWLPVPCGIAARMLWLGGANDEELRRFIDGELPHDDIRALYRDAKEWLNQALDVGWAFGVGSAVLTRGGIVPRIFRDGPRPGDGPPSDRHRIDGRPVSTQEFERASRVRPHVHRHVE